MNIAFDTIGILSKNSKEKHYSGEVSMLIETIMQNHPNDYFFGINFYNDTLEHNWSRFNFSEIDVYAGTSLEILRMPKYKNILGRIISEFINENHIDIFIFTDPFNPVITVYQKEWFNNIVTISLMNNFLPEKEKESFFTSRSVQKKYHAQVEMLYWVDYLLPSSVAAEDYIVENLRLDNKRIVKNLSFENIIPNYVVDNTKSLEKLAVFTPLPPLPTGIANYICPILVALSASYDIDVFIDNEYTPNCELPDNVKIYRHYDFYDRRNDYGAILYETGNSNFHTYMFDYIKEFLGIVEVHDFNMHNELYEMTKFYQKKGLFLSGEYFRAYWNKLLEDMPSYEAARQICLRLANRTSGAMNEVAVNGYVVNSAKKIIVHNEYSKNKLLGKNLMANIEVIPLYAPLIDECQIVRCTANDEPVKFVSLGHIAVPKRPLPVIKAFQRLLDEGYNAQLIFVGENHLENVLEPYQQILKNHLIVAGYVDDMAFFEYMKSADVILNLRYPYFGESSAVLCQALGMKKCTIVNDIGFFHELPKNVCIKIPDVRTLSASEEIEHIYSAMKKTCDQGLRDKIGHLAYRYAKCDLNLKIIVKKYMDIINNDSRTLPITNAFLHELLRNDYSLDSEL